MHDDGHMGLGLDLSHAGNSRDEHRGFHDDLDPYDQVYIEAVCQIPYRYRTPQEEAYCLDIGE